MPRTSLKYQRLRSSVGVSSSTLPRWAMSCTRSCVETMAPPPVGTADCANLAGRAAAALIWIKRGRECRRSVEDERAVGELVRVLVARREVGGQEVADRLNAGDDARFEPARGELALHRAADRLPRRRPDPAVDAPVGDDLDAPVGEQQVDEHAGVLLGIPDAQPAEELDRAVARRDAADEIGERQRGLDREAELAVVAALVGGDRLLDRLHRPRRERVAHRPVVGEQVAEDPAHAHLVAPAPGRAATAEPAPATRPAAPARPTAAAAPAPAG